MKRFLLFLTFINYFIVNKALDTIPDNGTVVFFDNFNDEQSYFSEPTLNATNKEYVNSIKEGHLPKKWKYTWNYSYEGDWRQAFFCIPKGEGHMEQAGRSACIESLGNFRIITNVPLPEYADRYIIEFKQWKGDNDPFFYLINTDTNGYGVEIGYENQLPGTDTNSNDAYIKGDINNGSIVKSMGTRFVWMDVKIDVRVSDKYLIWKMNDQVMAYGRVNKLKQGGYFGLRTCYDRYTKFDDFKITIYNKYVINEVPDQVIISPNLIYENEPVGKKVGILSTVDPNIKDLFTYSLIESDSNVYDNSSFVISNDTLYSKRTFDYETKNQYKILLKTTDHGGLSKIQELTVKIVNKQETNQINYDESNELFSVFPNPYKDYLIVEKKSNLNSNFKIEILDLMGNSIFQKELTSDNISNRIDMNNFNQGIYLIQIHTNNTIFSKKIFRINNLN